MKTLLEHETVKTSLYDTDFYSWTQEQAALLRQVPQGAFELDVENLVEEIESMGRSEVREVSSLIRQILIHLVKLVSVPDSPSRMHWLGEVINFQVDAQQTFTPSMKQRIELERVWHSARNTVTNLLRSAELHVPALPATCPLSLDELLAVDFDLGKMMKRMETALEAASRSPM